MNNINQFNVLLAEDDFANFQYLKECITKLPYLKLLNTENMSKLNVDVIENLKPDIIIADLTEYNRSIISFICNSTFIEVQIIALSNDTNLASYCFDLGIIDFIKKPFVFERFTESICRVIKFYQHKRIIHLQQINNSKEEIIDRAFIWVKSDKKFIHIRKIDIIRVECLRDFVRIDLLKKKFITNLTMNKIEQELSGKDFLRVNRSFIVNVNHIECIYGNTIETPIGEIPVGTNYRDLLKNLYC